MDVRMIEIKTHAIPPEQSEPKKAFDYEEEEREKESRAGFGFREIFFLCILGTLLVAAFVMAIGMAMG